METLSFPLIVAIDEAFEGKGALWRVPIIDGNNTTVLDVHGPTLAIALERAAHMVAVLNMDDEVRH